MIMDEEENKNNKNNDEGVKKLIFCLCYIWGILFFLPMIMYKDDEEAMRHANEGLVLLLFSVIGSAIFGCFSIFGGFIGRLFGALAGVYGAIMLILGIIGIVYILTDKKEDLPVIGKIKILK